MSFDRQAKEQEALKFLSKGNHEKALNCYKELLKHDVRDRRIRQKLADLYNRHGRAREAEKHYEELINLYGQDGNARAALAVHKQLVSLSPKDMERLGSMGVAYLEAGFPKEAEKHLDKAIDGLAPKDPELAADYACRLQDLRPGDQLLRIRTAELLASARKKDRAFDTFMDVIGEMRRCGRMKEVGKLAQQALLLKPEAPDLLQDAAEAALAVDDASGALKHLQTAYQENPKDVRTLDLLARAFEMGPEKQKAKPILIALDDMYEKEGRYAERVLVLERAIKVDEGNGELDSRLEQARKSAEIAALRLLDLDCVQATEEDAALVVRSRVFLDYDMAQKLLPDLESQQEESPESLGCQVSMAEVLAAMDRKEDALVVARSLLDHVPAEDRIRVEQRIATLSGGDLSAYFASGVATESSADEDEDWGDDELLDDIEEDDSTAAAAEALVDDDEELVDDDEDLVDDAEELVDDDEGLVDDDEELVEDEVEKSSAESPAVEVEDLSFDKGDKEGLFGGIFKEGTIAEIDPGEGSPEGGGDIDEARSLVSLGLYDEAQEILSALEGLAPLALLARCRREKGDLKGAFNDLKRSLGDAEDDEPGMDDALFEMAELASRLGKHRAALRYLGELQDIAPDFRPEEVEENIAANKTALKG